MTVIIHYEMLITILHSEASSSRVHRRNILYVVNVLECQFTPKNFMLKILSAVNTAKNSMFPGNYLNINLKKLGPNINLQKSLISTHSFREMYDKEPDLQYQ